MRLLGYLGALGVAACLGACMTASDSDATANEDTISLPARQGEAQPLPTDSLTASDGDDDVEVALGGNAAPAPSDSRDGGASASAQADGGDAAAPPYGGRRIGRVRYRK